MRQEERNLLLRSWHSLHDRIMQLDEKEVNGLLETEKAGDRRLHMLLRLHARLSRLRQERERAELMEIAAREIRRGEKTQGSH